MVVGIVETALKLGINIRKTQWRGNTANVIECNSLSLRGPVGDEAIQINNLS